jgi:MAF protein
VKSVASGDKLEALKDLPFMLPIVLASGSSYRRQLMEKLGLHFETHAPNVNETPSPNETPQQLAGRLATDKAQAIAHLYPSHLIIASDQVAALSHRILGKPGNHQAATEQLLLCSGKSVCFYTGLTLLNTQSHTLHNLVEPFTVHFRELTAEQIDYYLLMDKPYDCAGSFKAEGLGICLFKRLEGNDPNALIGLPLIQLVSLLNKEGIHLP